MRGSWREDATDEELVRAVQQDAAGEDGRGAAEALFDRYWRRVYLWCHRRVGNHDTACDLAQDVLLSAYQNIRSFEGRCLYSSWLFTIMRNRCFRALRRPSLVRDEDAEMDRLADGRLPIDDAIAEKEDEESLLRLVQECLDPIEQEALWLRVVERIPVDEITVRLKLTAASGARGVLQSGRRKLRAAMAKREDRPEGDRP